MTALLLAAGLGVIAGGGLAVGALGLSRALGGLLGLLVLAPLLTDPLPSTLSFAVRVVGALLTVELLWITLRRLPGLRRPSPLGLRAVLLAGFAAAVVGFALLPSAGGPPAVLGDFLVGVDAGRVARAGALGLAVVALPLVLGRGPMGSIAIGSAVLLSGAELLLAGLIGPRSPLEHLLLAATQALLAAGALVVVAAAPVGPPLAGRMPVAGASATDGAVPPFARRRRIPIWPGIRSVSTWPRRRPPAP